MGHAALLIDWENFFLNREEVCSGRGQQFDYANDLQTLLGFAQDMVERHAARLTVRRAYADFNTARKDRASGRREYYLQRTPVALMQRGVEPVQVFRYPGGFNKNAADIRMTVDALRLATDDGGIAGFILVTGDADFIPLAIDLRRLGKVVAVIGVTGHTKMVFQRYCDSFDLFEDLVAKSDVEQRESADLERIRGALGATLEERGRLPFAAVRPLLVERMGAPIDTGRFNCDNVGDLLRRYAAQLGVRVEKGENDWFVHLPGPDGEVTPKARAADIVHTPGSYDQLLRKGWPRIFVVPYADWRPIVEGVHAAAVGARSAGEAVVLDELRAALADSFDGGEMEEVDWKVQSVLYQMLFSSSFDPFGWRREDVPDANLWKEPVRLIDTVETVDELEARIRGFIERRLREELERRHGRGHELRSEVLVELLGEPETGAPLRASGAAGSS